MPEAPYGPKELAADLRRLMEHQPADEDALDDWYARTHEVKLRIEAAPESFPIPGGIWRWLNDADMRLSTPWYDEMCTRMLMDALRELET